MKNLTTSRFRPILRQSALLIALSVPPSAWADDWQLQVGAQNGDQETLIDFRSHSALKYL